MKIGILSMQQITNYGSFLQAYALKSLLQKMGHTVSFINIKPGEQLPEYKIGKFHKVKLMLRRMVVRHPLEQLKVTLRLHKRFDREFKPELGVANEIDDSPKDAVVIGSDEVFNIAQTTWFGFSPQLFGEGLNTAKVISYAGSFGATTISKLDELNLRHRIEELLNNFKSISIRDKNSFDVVKDLTSKEPELNIDPVLAYGYEDEIIVPKVDVPYLFIYTYPGRMNDSNEVKAIKEYAQKNDLRIIANGNYFDWVDEVVVPHPFEMLGYVKNAAYVVTDTFHGTVMSIKYNRSFATLVRGMNSNKLSFLLEQFNLSERKVSNLNDLDKILDTPIDYSPINKKIEEEKLHTKEYLKKALN